MKLKIQQKSKKIEYKDSILLGDFPKVKIIEVIKYIMLLTD